MGLLPVMPIVLLLISVACGFHRMNYREIDPFVEVEAVFKHVCIFMYVVSCVVFGTKLNNSTSLFLPWMS
jgi:hypothetical protein